MTNKEILFNFRMNQAMETLADAEKMVTGDFSPRSIVNRAYYSMFYSVLSLCLKNDVPLSTSKHYGVIAVFDLEFVKTGKFDKKYSEALHAIFEERQESDYVELVEVTKEDAVHYLASAKKFVMAVRHYLG